MFSRLNEAVPLNAAEKRNAIGGELVAAIRKLSKHKFFTQHVKFPNKRYQHHEASARFLLVEENISRNSRLVDTKKVYLDALAKNYHTGHSAEVKKLLKSCNSILNEMTEFFGNDDDLLRAQGNMVIYYLLFRLAIHTDNLKMLSRKKLINFNKRLKENRTLAESDYEKSSFDLLEYDRLTQQGTNDAANIKERLSILARNLGIKAAAINNFFSIMNE